jgi:glutaredoxin
MNELRVYWQPGCTSCLAAKQFLTRHGIAFESVNVREQRDAMAQLQALGARSVPVVSRGARWVYAQELRELANFVGVTEVMPPLPAQVLLERIDALLCATANFTREMPPSLWEQALSGRSDRCAIDIPFHIAQIVNGLLDAADGGELTYAHFERRPETAARNATAVTQLLSAVHARFSLWRVNSSSGQGSRVLTTYYGAQPLNGVLERTAWHVAQHARQIEHLLVGHGVQPASPLGDKELRGLPLPEGVWDAEAGRGC